MERRFARPHVRPFLSFVAMAAVAVAAATPSSRTSAKPPPPTRDLLALLAALRPAGDGYRLQDGKVVYGTPDAPEGAGQASGSPTPAGGVDTLDLNKAYARAAQLARQAQGR